MAAPATRPPRQQPPEVLGRRLMAINRVIRQDYLKRTPKRRGSKNRDSAYDRYHDAVLSRTRWRR